jgi:uncharacterized protein Yka (UPF0111/DUF47 family)
VSRGRARWFLPDNGDVLGMLAAQVEVTTRGLEAFARWGAGNAADSDVVRAAEHEADDRRREVVAAIRTAFTTPLEPEDLFEISSGLDDVLNRSKDIVRETEALAMTPDEPMAEMCLHISEGVQHLGSAITALGDDPAAATTEAAAAIKAQRNLERTYRAAMGELIDQSDLREVIGRQELYRRLVRVADGIVAVADRVIYSTVKEG